MRYGISSWIVAVLEPAEAVAALAEAGFDRVELSDDNAPLVKAWEADPVRVTAQLAQAGLTVTSAHSPNAGRQLDHENEGVRLASLQENLRYFDLMQRSGVPEMIVHPISYDRGWSEPERLEATARSRDSLVRLSEAAAEFGVRLAVENIGRDALLGGGMASLLQLIDGVGEHVGLCHDIGHTVQAGFDIVAEGGYALGSGRLFSLHLHDVDAELRDHFIPGEGTLDYGPYLAQLAEARFEGVRTLEVAKAETATRERTAAVGVLAREWEALP